MLLIIFFILLIIFTKIGLVFRHMDLGGKLRNKHAHISATISRKT